MKVEVKSIDLNSGHTKKGFEILCTADISLPEVGVGFSGVALSWSAERGFHALTPIALFAGKRVCHWRRDSALAVSVAAAILDSFVRMGGKLPDGAVLPDPTGSPPNPVSAKQLEAAITAGLVRDYERTISVTTKPRKPVPVRTVEEIDLAEMGLSRPVDPAVLRTLGMAQ
jgi:hypothetical protein